MTANQPDSQSQQPERRNPFFLIIIILVGGVVPLLAVAFFINGIFGSLSGISGLNAGDAPEGPLSRPLSGNPGRFDPLMALPEVADFAGISEPVELISFRAYAVRPDGTMDLNATSKPGPHVEYLFVHEFTSAATAEGDGSAAAVRSELVTVEVYHPGEAREATETVDGELLTYTYGNEGMIRRPQPPAESVDVEVAPQPQCGLYQLWSVAVNQGIPQDSIATITYDASGYTFAAGDSAPLLFGLDCALRE